MAAQGVNQAITGLPVRLARLPRNALAFWLAGLVAAGLSLAAAFVGFSGGAKAPSQPGPDAATQLQLRNQRIQFFEDRARRDPIDTTSLNSLAGDYLQRARETGDPSDYQRAADATEQTLAVLPNDYAGLVLSAQVNLAQHNFARTLDLATRAIPVRPDIGAAYGARGDAEIQIGLYDAAAKDYQDMLTREPNLTALSRQANLSYLKGDLLNATSFWKQAMASAHGLPIENLAWVHVQLAQQDFDQGDLKSSEKEAQAALVLYPNYVHALAALGAVRAAQGRWGESIALYSRGQDLLPQVQYVIALGDVYKAAGRGDDAERQYQLVGAIDKLYRANGINTDLQISLFYANHGRNLDEALALARANYAANSGIYAADGLAWVYTKTAGTPRQHPWRKRPCA